jgi:hypothetical protein
MRPRNQMTWPTVAVLALALAACGDDSGDDDDDDDDDTVVIDAAVIPDSGDGSDAATSLGACDSTPPWTGTDNVAASASPPGGLQPAQVPQFVSIGFDDNFRSDAILWITDLLKSYTNPAGSGAACTYDGTPVRASFYLTSVYITEAGATESAAVVKRAWHKEMVEGNEIGNHTHTHSDGVAKNWSQKDWTSELQTCLDWLIKPFNPAESTDVSDPTKGIGASAANIVGFRTPFLAYNDITFATLDAMGFWYDCTIEDGWSGAEDGTNHVCPYTMDQGSPGNDTIQSHPGLWELPLYPVIVPPDDKCAEYGVPTGLRAKMHGFDAAFDLASGKITGLDYNMWILYQMTKAEFVATMKYTLDLHLQGNRTPFMFGAHPDFYSAEPTDEPVPNATYTERREALQEYLEYALAKPEVRVVPNRAILDWLRNPIPLQ